MTDGPVFDQVNLVVSDMDAALAFYRRLGLSFGDMPEPWAAHHREAKTGATTVELDSARSAEIWGGVAPPVVLNLRLPSPDAVDATWADLTGAGYAGASAPHDVFWGSRYAIVVDPDGNHVGLMSPPDPAKRTAPPDP